MDELGKILVPKTKPTLKTNDTLTGDGNNTLLGLNYSAWKFNTDELLWSGGPQSSIKVNFPLNLYERVMFRLGHNGYGKQFEEYSTNNTRFYLNPLFAKNSANSEVWFETNEWRYGDTKRDLVWQGHCYRRNLKAGGGTFEDLNANVVGYDSEKYPISEVWGINRIDFNTYNVYLDYGEGGTLSSDKSSGYNGEICTLIIIPESDVWRQSALNITGAELTGNDFMFSNSNVTAQAEFEHSRNLTLENGDHGVLSADKMSGFSGDVVTVDATTDEGWYLSAIALTGAEATGFKFMFTGSDVTALGEYTDEGYPVTYEASEGGSLDGDPVFIPGSTGITLNSVYNTYYRLSGYDVTGGTITDGVLVADGPCTARAVYKVNYFTATGNFEKGSDVTCNAAAAANNAWTYLNVGEKYALHQNHTGDIPSSWYETSNRWKPNDASSYSITLVGEMKLSGSCNVATTAKTTATCLIGDTQSNAQSYSVAYATNHNPTNATWNYSKTITTTTQDVFYGVSAKLGAYRFYNKVGAKYATAKYIATGTNGTWTATGIAP